MTLQVLKYLIALARYQHFSRAAKACFVSQPTLSVAIQKLEDSLNVSLFERYKSQVALTAVGEEIVEQAKTVLRESALIEQIAASSQDPLTGPLRLGSILTVGPYLLPRLVPKLNKLAPNMPLEIQEDFTENLDRKLHEGELDAIILAEPFNRPNTLKKKLYEEKFVALLPKKHRLGARKLLKPADLQGENIMLLGKGHCFREHVLNACPSCYVDSLQSDSGIRASTFEGASLETIRHMVASGTGITILPASAAHLPAYLKSILTTVPLQAKNAKREIILVWRAQFPRLKAIHAIAEAVQ